MLAQTIAYHLRWLPEETIVALQAIEPFRLYLLPAACSQCCMWTRGETRNAPQGHFACSSWGDAISIADQLRIPRDRVVQVAGPWYGDHREWRQIVAIPERLARGLERSAWWRDRRLSLAAIRDEDTWR